MHTLRPLAAPRLAEVVSVAIVLIPILLYSACAGGFDGEPDDVTPSRDPAPDVDLAPVDAGSIDQAEAAVWRASDATSSAWSASSSTPPVAERDLDPLVDAAPGDGGKSVGAPRGPPAGGCVVPLGPGVLAIDELMIASVAGAGDYGEWVEVMSQSDCAVNLNGLHGDSPVGRRVHAFDITSDVWLLPHATFVVANSSDPAIDHDLPGPIVEWKGQPSDVLRNLGGTVTLSAGSALVDAVTYPRLKSRVGASVAFPSDCPPATRLDFTRWQPSVHAWFPGFAGTPNAPNDDVHCRDD